MKQFLTLALLVLANNTMAKSMSECLAYPDTPAFQKSKLVCILSNISDSEVSVSGENCTTGESLNLETLRLHRNKGSHQGRLYDVFSLKYGNRPSKYSGLVIFRKIKNPEKLITSSLEVNSNEEEISLSWRYKKSEDGIDGVGNLVISNEDNASIKFASFKLSVPFTGDTFGKGSRLENFECEVID